MEWIPFLHQNKHVETTTGITKNQLTCQCETSAWSVSHLAYSDSLVMKASQYIPASLQLGERQIL